MKNEARFENSPLQRQMKQAKNPSIYKNVVEMALEKTPNSSFWSDALLYIKKNSNTNN
jgi:hypothetical protein